MAQLKNTIVNGILRANTIAANKIKDSTGAIGISKVLCSDANGNLVWNSVVSASTNSTTVNTVVTASNASFYLTFVDSNNLSATGEALYTNGGISYNPSSSTLSLAGRYNSDILTLGNARLRSLSDSVSGRNSLILYNTQLRFGNADWDWNQWAGLNYDHTNKIVKLGLADGVNFTANSAQIGGNLLLTGIDKINLTNKWVGITKLSGVNATYNLPVNVSSAATITVPGSSGSNGLLLFASEEASSDYGALYIGTDGAVIANSGDNGYVFKVYDKDKGSNYTTNTAAAGFRLGIAQTDGTSILNSNFSIAGTLSTSGVYTNTVADGTSPMAITSSTLVSNLNSDLLDGYHASAFPRLSANNTFTGSNTFDSVTYNGNLVVNGSAVFNAGLTGNLTGNASTATNSGTTSAINTTYSFNKSLTLTNGGTWYDTGISGTDLVNGTYIVQIFCIEQVKYRLEHFSGTMSWFSGASNSTDSDEILLHACGGHATNGDHIYLRILRQMANTTVKLQIARKKGLNSARIYRFKFTKIIGGTI